METSKKRGGGQGGVMGMDVSNEGRRGGKGRKGKGLEI